MKRLAFVVVVVVTDDDKFSCEMRIEVVHGN